MTQLRVVTLAVRVALQEYRDQKLYESSDISFKKTFCFINIRPQNLLSDEPTLWFRRHQLFGLGTPSF